MSWTQAGQDSASYAVVFDGGSTGSRVHIFEFSKRGKELKLVKDTFHQLKPGLGDAGWAADPQKSAASLQPLIDKAVAAVPEDKQAVTPVELRATAGLRLLPGKQAVAILEAVGGLLLTTPFRTVPNGVTIMDGADEGAFAWLTLNYLLGKTGKPAQELVGAIDLGGGSVQAAFAVDEKTASVAPTGVPLEAMESVGITATQAMEDALV
jgi:apyrase